MCTLTARKCDVTSVTARARTCGKSTEPTKCHAHAATPEPISSESHTSKLYGALRERRPGKRLNKVTSWLKHDTAGDLADNKEKPPIRLDAQHVDRKNKKKKLRVPGLKIIVLAN